MHRPGRRGRGARPGRLDTRFEVNPSGVTRQPYTVRPTDGRNLVALARLDFQPMGFNPYARIRRARMTRRGDILFLAVFGLLIAAMLVWAML